jgi:serine/threonine protein kinase
MVGYLRIVAGPDEGQTIDLEAGLKLIFGRSDRADVQLKDLQASRLHCELRVGEDGTPTLVDLSSAAGTKVNGQAIREQVLHHGDTIRLGATELRLHLNRIPDASRLVAAQKPARELQAGSPADAVGQTISHFTVLDVLAKGKTGMLYKARDTRDDKDVAFKLLFEGFADDEEDLQRFVRAMTTAIALKHPNIVALHGAGKHGRRCWLAMEYVDGESLTKVIERHGSAGMLEWPDALKVAAQVARALEAAHAQQIIHRNVIPENILIRRGDGAAKLGDLMLAKALSGIKATPITRPGQLVGDLVYMAPERTREDATVDARSDLYGLGATLYALLTGRPPFAGKSLVETVSMIRQAAPVPPKQFQPAVPDALQDAVLKLLAKRPEQRHASAAQAARELERIAREEGVEA